MASYSIPVRLSANLASRAREAAEIQDRSLTEQVEHWARLGEVVEATVVGATLDKLKMVSHDPRLPKALADADTSAGRRRAAELIAKRNPIRYGTTVGSPHKVVKVESRTKKRP